MVSNRTEPSPCNFVHSALVLSQEEVLRILPEQRDPEAVRLQETLPRPFRSLTLIPGSLIFIRITLRSICSLIRGTHEMWEGGIETWKKQNRCSLGEKVTGREDAERQQ